MIEADHAMESEIICARCDSSCDCRGNKQNSHIFRRCGLLYITRPAATMAAARKQIQAEEQKLNF